MGTGSSVGFISLFDLHNLEKKWREGRGGEGQEREKGRLSVRKRERKIKRQMENQTRGRKKGTEFWGCSVLFVPLKLSVKLQCVAGESLSLI